MGSPLYRLRDSSFTWHPYTLRGGDERAAG
jgi:hypothetical protein